VTLTTPRDRDSRRSPQQHGAQPHGVQQRMRAVSRCQLTQEAAEPARTCHLQLQQVAGEMRPSLMIAWSIVTTVLYKLLRLVFIAVQSLHWQLNGTARKLREARLPHNYERSAQVLDVVLRHKFSEFIGTSIDHFLCTHNRFENPQYIIDNDNINLMTISDHDALFCETEKKGRQTYV